MRIATLCLCILSLALTLAGQARAAVVEYEQKPAWIAAAGAYSTVDFTGFPANTIITTQYQSWGITFTDGTDRIFLSDNAFPNDDTGLNGALDTIHLAFSQPMHHIAVDFPGWMQIRLYWQGELTYTSSDFMHVGVGFFAGLISDRPFDAAILEDPSGGVFIDDLHFGPPIPAPSPLALLTLPLLAPTRSRRHQRSFT